MQLPHSVATNKRRLFLTLYGWLTCAYIVISPINTALDAFPISILSVINIMLISCFTIASIIYRKFAPKPIFLIVLVIFVLEFFISYNRNNNVSYGLLIMTLLYVTFNNCEFSNIRIIVVSVCFSTIVAAAVSVMFGIIYSSSILRTGIYASGNISIVALCTLLFLPDCIWMINRRDAIFKIVALISSIIVVLLTMSRIRIVVCFVLIFLYAIMKLRNIIAVGKMTRYKLVTGILLILIIAIVFFSLFSSEVGRELMKMVSDRMTSFSDRSREDEIALGLDYFATNVLTGKGWQQIRFTDFNHSVVDYNNHCSYVAVLARGGLAFAVPMFCSLLFMIVEIIRTKKCKICMFMCIFCFLTLMYTSAALYNYSALILICVTRTLLNHEKKALKKRR